MTVRILVLALASAAPVLLVTTFLTGSAADDEEFRWVVLSTLLFVRALADGTAFTWTSLLGFGVPQPMVPNFQMHPLAPLLAAVPPATWVRMVYATHTVVGAIGMWRLARMLQLTPVTRAVCVFTFLLATPTQNYALTDFWPSHYVTWMSAPWLLMLAWRLLESTGRDLARVSVLLGICAGLVLATSNPAHILVYGTVILPVLGVRWRAVVVRWPGMLLAAAIALAITGPNLVQLAAERAVFAENLGLIKTTDPLPASAAWDVFLRPLPASDHVWEIDVVSRGTRVLFFGGPFAALSLVGLFLLGRKHLDLAIGTALPAVLLFTPLLPLTFISRFHYRDPTVLCAIPLAGLAADYLLRLPRARWAAIVLLTAQVFVVAAAASPFLGAYRDERQAMWFEAATAATPAVDRLLPLLSRGGRLAYSPQVDYEISRRERVLDGFGVNGLAYRGVSLVNGSFKAVSTDVLWPDDYLFYGRIRIPRQLAESDDGLDLLGIRYLLAKMEEPVAPGLRRVATIPSAYRDPLLLYENPDAWPGAFVIDNGVAHIPSLPVHPDCSNDRLLCKDLTPLARLRRPEQVEMTRRGPQIRVNVASSSDPRLLVVSEMFRPEWVARDESAPLPTVSVGPGLLGVPLPAGASTVTLEYRPTLLTSAIVLAWCAAAGSVVALVLLSGRRRSGSKRAIK